MNKIPFDHVVADSTSKFHKVKKEDYSEYGNYRIVDQGKEFIAGYTNDKTLVNFLSTPAIIFGDHTRIFKYIDFPLALGADGTKVLTIKNNLADVKYLYYYFRTLKLTDAGYSRHFKFLKAVKIPLPENYVDQIRIATVLTRAEKLIAKRKESIQALDELLKSIFAEMFGNPVKNNKGWEKKTLKDVCLKITDGTHFSPPITEEGIPYITAKHVRENKIDFHAKPWYISEEEHKEIYKRCDPQKGDILYIKDGATTGYAAINKYEFEFSMLSSLALLRVDNEICNAEYLCNWLNNPIVKSRILLGMSGGAIQRLTLAKINALTVNVPPLSLQNQFAAFVEKVESLKVKYTKSLIELENLYGSLSQRAFKGELDLSKVVVGKEMNEIGLLQEIHISISGTDELVEVKKYSEFELDAILKSQDANGFTFESLMKDIEKASFHELPSYEQLKAHIYNRLAGTKPILVQEYDAKNNEMILRLST